MHLRMMQCLSALTVVSPYAAVTFLQERTVWQIFHHYYRFYIFTLYIFLPSSPSPLSRQRPSSPATPKGRTASPSPAASPKPPSTHGSPSTPKARPKRARTPARIEHRTSSPVPLERVKEPRRPGTPENRRSKFRQMLMVIVTDTSFTDISLDFLLNHIVVNVFTNSSSLYGWPLSGQRTESNGEKRTHLWKVYFKSVWKISISFN